MRTYLEVAPPGPLFEHVECFWVSRERAATGALQRVLPDGCADIIYTRTGKGGELRFAGPMTRYADFAQAPGSLSVGVRFRPGMWSAVVHTRAAYLVDRLEQLDDVWDSLPRDLLHKLDDATQSGRIVDLLSQAIRADNVRSPVQRAIGSLERSHGALPLGDLAHAAGLSTRQFRRRCLEATGLSPKMLSRILRLRKATALVGQMTGPQAGIAAACGYADQSHFIAECREFCGWTPKEMSVSLQGRLRGDLPLDRAHG